MTIQQRAPVHPAKAPAATPRVSGEVFGKLINLSGRRRFTSQRVVLFAVLARQGRDDALAASREALATFVAAHHALTAGGDDLPGVFCEALRQVYFGPPAADAAIGHFIGLARRAQDAIEAGMRGADALVDELVDHTTPLLAALNAVTQVYEDLAREHAARGRASLVAVMGDIQAIARAARVVSFNAQVVAARPQVSGQEFAVVANELSRVTGRIDDLLREAVAAAAR